MRKHIHKKAFTMVELLVCLVCLGFLTVGIGAFASAINTNVVYLNDRENKMINEYQDVLNLKVNGASAQSALNNTTYLVPATKIVRTESFDISSLLNLESSQKAEYSIDDSSIATVNSHGQCLGISEGVTYVKVNILTIGDDGEYHDYKNVKYFPIVVYNNSNLDNLADLEYYFYGGKYYSCWIYGQ